MSAAAEPVAVVWFKRDLRTADHAPLLAAAASAAPVLPLFIVEPEWWRLPTQSGRQWAFAAESLAELRADLARLGAPLVVRVGEAVAVLERARRRYGALTLWSHEETGDAWTFARDRRVGAWARAHGVDWREAPPAGVVRRLRSRDGWAAAWERRMADAPAPEPSALRPVTPTPELGALPTAAQLGLAPDPCPGRQPGGRRAALERLESFLAARGRGYRAEMATPVRAFDACSRLSAPLAWGAVSTREALQAVRARRAMLDPTAPDARLWRGAYASFEARLHWRCHFMQKLEDEPALETRCLLPAYEGLRPRESDAARLEAWAVGRTGWPFVDACRRALIATGWMNFRMRAMLVSVAGYQLWLDWRATGAILARDFTDLEPGIHWPQMQMQSGVTGVNATRVYDPVKQGLDQDPSGVFLRAWLPELAHLPTPYLHRPWTMDRAAQTALGVTLGRDYPAPIVDAAEAAREAKARVHAVRREAGFAAAAAEVARKHASRKPGRDVGGRRRGASRPSERDGQLRLDL